MTDKDKTSSGGSGGSSGGSGGSSSSSGGSGTTEICPTCGGRKIVAVGTDEFPCDVCGGKGTVKR
jgi:hypothetical protein